MYKTILSIIVLALLSTGIIWWIYGSSTSQSTALQGINTNQITLPYGNSDSSTSTVTTPSQPAQKNNNQQKFMNATLHTNKGDISIEFLPSQAPQTVENFTKLASSGFYDGVKFHRVIKDFMIQGGDPLTKDDSKQAMWGTGGPGYKFADEITAMNKNDEGTLSMANSGPNTNGSQFFINLRNNNFLDTKHTVFGRVTQGIDVVRAIEAVETNASDRPLEPIIIKNITLH
jgi:cyclophilin family peptidyl-prolyl cis-trans isomerase